MGPKSPHASGQPRSGPGGPLPEAPMPEGRAHRIVVRASFVRIPRARRGLADTDAAGRPQMRPGA